MLILFDHGIPAPLRSHLKDHIVKKDERSWLGYAKQWRTPKSRRRSRLRDLPDNRQEHPLLTKSRGPNHCYRGSRQFTMAGRTAVHRSGRAAIAASKPGTY